MKGSVHLANVVFGCLLLTGACDYRGATHQAFPARWQGANRETRRQLIVQGALKAYLSGKHKTEIIALLGRPDTQVPEVLVDPVAMHVFEPGALWYEFSWKEMLIVTFDRNGRSTGCRLEEIPIRGGPDLPRDQ